MSPVEREHKELEAAREQYKGMGDHDLLVTLAVSHDGLARELREHVRLHKDDQLSHAAVHEKEKKELLCADHAKAISSIKESRARIHGAYIALCAASSAMAAWWAGHK